MDEQKIKEFNVELGALLIKYDVTLGVKQDIMISPKKKPELLDTAEGKSE